MKALKSISLVARVITLLWLCCLPVILNAQSEVIEIPCSEYQSDQDYFRAFDSGTSNNMSTAMAKARMRARTTLAGTINTEIKAESKLAGDNFEQIINSSVNQSLSGATTVCSKTVVNENGTYTTYIAMEVKKQTVSDKLYNQLPEEYMVNSLKKSEEPETDGMRGSSANFSDLENALNIGTYYALLIGVQSYEDEKINDLDQPLKDVDQLYRVLTEEYTFSADHVVVLQDATKNEITNQLDLLSNTLKANDNLLIFYAGHGFWDENFEQGYWLPADSREQMRGSYISNSTIRDYMKGIPSQHILLITDACFSGGIFKSRAAFPKEAVAINQLYRSPSRVAITSGTLTEVPDKSVFIEYLVKQLSLNDAPYLSAEQLFSKFKFAVINNSKTKQIPQYGKVYNAGDEGGDFIFVKN